MYRSCFKSERASPRLLQESERVLQKLPKSDWASHDAFYWVVPFLSTTMFPLGVHKYQALEIWV